MQPPCTAVGYIQRSFFCQREAQCKWLSWVDDDTGCRQPRIKHRIKAPAIDGANGMRFLSPTCWTCAQPNLAATTCSVAKIASRTANGSAQRKPTHRKPTVNILTSPPPIKFGP